MFVIVSALSTHAVIMMHAHFQNKKKKKKEKKKKLELLFLRMAI